MKLVKPTPKSTEALHYTPLVQDMRDGKPVGSPETALAAPDRRDGRVYVLNDRLKLAVDVVLATGRPLLLRGDPGSGKSSLAAYVARNLGWRYYEHVVTSRTSANDLLWTFDMVRKLADAQRGDREARELNDHDYVEPGVLWWAFHRDSAFRRGAPSIGQVTRPAVEPGTKMNEGRSPDHAVVLLDEIDKADPDVPNGLLVPLGSTEFRIRETGTLIRQSEPAREAGWDTRMGRHLIVITTNEERELPAAFLRRCVVHELKHPDARRLVQIARRHIKSHREQFTKADHALCWAIAKRLEMARSQARGRTKPPSTAEYLDAVRACRTLNIGLDGPTWKEIERLTLLKGAKARSEGA
jgi:MoxR-like ATPase